MKGIWYEFISPNNIYLVCLGKYNWELVDEYGWNKFDKNFDKNSNLNLMMRIGSPINEHYTLTYEIKDKILHINDVKILCEIDKLNDTVDNIVTASGFKVLPLFSIIPDGFDKHLRLQKIKRLLGK